MNPPISGLKSTTAAVGVDGAHYFLGIDLGGTKIHFALSDAHGQVLRDRITPNDATSPRELADSVGRASLTLLAQANVYPEDVRGVGVGIAGAVNVSNGQLALAPNLQGTSTSHILDALTAIFDAPVRLDNDVNLAALGEWRRGVATGETDFVFIAVGTGIGMGIVAEGTLVRGARNAAGEIGYLPIGADPLDPLNHSRGPLEELVAGEEIAIRYTRQTGKTVTTRNVFDLAGAGDTVAIASIEVEARYVAQAVVAVRSVLDPAMVVLGGGVGSRTEMLPLIQAWLIKFGATGVDIRTSALGADASVLGAIELARERGRPEMERYEPERQQHPTSVTSVRTHRDGRQ
ncbi:ROK family protein [Herbiconiux sp. 11R-BC]|uniref:ROK family protein n=1 Tax=Herbiconiux sp. 11R-BC TaxID=3111637 RepID=UPI003C0DA40B